ncbi:MAG: hypothetical protein ACC653_06280 [Gammaproteobacteria bacterium]
MSNNAVFCVSNNIKTIRLTVYRCKPNVFLTQLEKLLDSIGKNNNGFDIDAVVMALIENGFDLEAESAGSFTAPVMSTTTVVNWAWLLDLENNVLRYWDVTAALNGMQETIEQQSISPLDYCEWLGSDAVDDYKTAVTNSNNKLSDLGITIVNF